MSLVVKTLWGEEVVPSKRCIKCGEMKSLEEYGIRSYGKDGNKREYRNDCKVCWNKETKIRQKLKKENLHTMPSEDEPCKGCLISPKERMEKGMFTSPIKKIKTLWVCEHDHKTGKFRGWICDYCNTVIGRANEDPETLRRLANYLEESNDMMGFRKNK